MYLKKRHVYINEMISACASCLTFYLMLMLNKYTVQDSSKIDIYSYNDHTEFGVWY